ncbi:sensor histidine kinase [Brevundimonas goettingensis]|nr:HAMP domain-containing sensor histidine kinase [Brevundimonas goettingensis]
MIRTAYQQGRQWIRSHWPALRLRTILLSVLMFAAILPGLVGVFLRVYENTLVRQTESELIAQTAALSATAEALWPGAVPRVVTPEARLEPGYYQPEGATIDLGSTPVLPARPDVRPAPAPDPDAVLLNERLQPIADETARTTLASIVLLDGRGTVIDGYGKGGSLADLPEVRSALAGRPYTVLRRNADYHPRYSMEWLSRASGLRIHHARPIVVDGQVRGVILTSRSPRALFKGVYQDRIKIALGILGTLSVIAVLAVLVARGIARPIEKLSEAAREVTTGGGTLPPAPATSAVEIRTLYEDFSLMAEAVDRRSRYLRDFAAAVSHEFKTPLAGIQGAVELLQDHGETMETGQRKRFLDNIAADARRLAGLVTRLLDLARADMARPDANLAIDVVPAVSKAVDARAGELEITVDLNDPPPVAVPPATLEMVISTLLENSRQAGATRVVISARGKDRDLILTVADDGPGVPPGDADRVFEPFFTSKRSEGGAGLGLSIAVSLLAASRASIRLRPTTEGATFEVTLPIAGR